MLRSVNEIRGAYIHAEDGQVGSVETLYFDDESWNTRYFVVGAGNLSTNRDVLLSPEMVREEDTTARVCVLRSGLTKEEIKNAPGTITDPPVATQQRTAYLAISPYPVTGGAATPAGMPSDARTLRAMDGPEPSSGERSPRTEAPHLRSTREVRGYRVRTPDGEIGHVEDFVVDPEGWIIRYVVVDTRNWLPGKKVLVASSWISGVSWADAEVCVDPDSIEIKEAPAWNADLPVDRAYEEKLYAYYGRTPYWVYGG